jgi:hypothetical protein
VVEPVLHKATSVRLWRSGAFGNKLRSWESVDAWRVDGAPGKVALRSCQGPGGNRCAYNVETVAGAERTVAAWAELGAPTGSIMVCEMAPPELTLVQGEYWNGFYRDNGSDLVYDTFVYSRMRATMREAMVNGPWTRPSVSHGLLSRLILREAMTPASYEDWQDLCERYPDHLVEVSVYDVCLGDLPHRNALVWEVRRY